DLHLVTLPGWLPAHLSTGRGTDHGSGWNPDTHVPLFFLGSGIVPGEVLERVQVTGIVPTLSLLLGQAFPDAADGPVIDGVLVR
ncbi:MAG TPA: alkaline phosphatase family protein, partial [Flavobacteriales bacterium]|nr:alkaline phosphatase family protein [Flavobacteriales bacterium]